MITTIGYQYEAGIHCLDHTRERFSNPNSDNIDYNGIDLDAKDSEGNVVWPLYDYEEWYELDPGFIAEHGPIQYLVCHTGDCPQILDIYRHL
mgnify:FL=1|tara:strand:+ start:55 stop:330 length:276 start_codon:yes stop_codon:yes gene_type:complete